MLARFLAQHAAQQAQDAAQDAAGVAMTLEEAIAERGRQQHATQIKNWYKQGYYKKTNGLWYSSVGGKERRKYSTI